MIDVSNSFTKIAVTRNGVIGKVRKIPTPDLAKSKLSSLEADRAVISSVVPPANLIFQQSLACPILWVGHKTAGVCIRYPKPATIGADRLANVAAAVSLSKLPAIVVDFGTAVTFDVIDTTGCYLGGIIAPGLGVMTQYLHERTALLPALDPSALLGGPAIGKSTVDAMRAGCALGFAGMIGALLDGVCAELVRQGSPMPKVIVTGGAAVYLPASWQTRVTHEPHLTLLGLAEAHRRHFA